VLAPLLPPRVRLAASARTHPLLLVFGEQANGATFFGGVALRWGIRYYELMVAIPFVRCDRAPGDHLLVCGMTCDFLPAAWNGNQFYGFRKQWTSSTWDGEEFVVTSREGDPAFRARLANPGPGEAGVLDWIRSISRQPVLGLRDDRTLVRSQFDWAFDDGAIEGCRVSAIANTAFHALPAGHYGSPDAVRVRGMRWRLGWPTPLAE
jgi:hypothetical protein